MGPAWLLVPKAIPKIVMLLPCDIVPDTLLIAGVPLGLGVDGVSVLEAVVVPPEVEVSPGVGVSVDVEVGSVVEDVSLDVEVVSLGVV
jgi:hypothetical protein